MTYQVDGLTILLKDFYMNLPATFDNGQCFRWNSLEDGSYRGVVQDQLVTVKLTPEGTRIKGVTEDFFLEVLWPYFDLDRDYEKIEAALEGIDDHMKEAVHFGRGMRLLQQDPFETIISFIISANNNMKRIKSIVDCLSRRYGAYISTKHGKAYHAFPSPEALAKASLEELRACGAGYRDVYIQKAAAYLADQPEMIKQVERASTLHGRELLKELPGVGNKVAECILLFSFAKGDVFPVDTWVKKIMRYLYQEEAKQYADIRDFHMAYFGEYAGLAQQYLFYYAREHKLGG